SHRIFPGPRAVAPSRRSVKNMQGLPVLTACVLCPHLWFAGGQSKTRESSCVEVCILAECCVFRFGKILQPDEIRRYCATCVLIDQPDDDNGTDSDLLLRVKS